MKRLLYTLGFIAALAFVACEKDAPVAPRPTTYTLETLLGEYDTAKISSRVWAWAGSHPSFEAERHGYPFRVQFVAPAGAFNFRLFLNDSVQYADSLKLYRLSGYPATMDSSGFFARFDLEQQPERNRLAHVVFETDDSLYVSAPVVIKNLTPVLQTDTVENVTVSLSPLGMATFRWKANSSAVTNLLWMTDRTGDCFCCVYTNSANFLFYDLRNVSTNLSPATLHDPRLVLGESYTMRIVCIDEHYWARAFTRFSFKADTVLGVGE